MCIKEQWQQFLKLCPKIAQCLHIENTILNTRMQMNKARYLSPRSLEFKENGLPIAEGNKQSCWHLGKWKITEIRGNFEFIKGDVFMFARKQVYI